MTFFRQVTFNSAHKNVKYQITALSKQTHTTEEME